MREALQTTPKHGRMLTVKDGYLVCPICRQNKRMMKINPDTSAHRAVAYCRRCKAEIIVDIDEGQCFESRSQ